MFRFLCFVSAALALSACSPHFSALAESTHPTDGTSGKSGTPAQPAAPLPFKVHWYTDYGEAMDVAASRRTVLVVFFQPRGRELPDAPLDLGQLGSPEVVQRLRTAVAVRLPVDATSQAEEGSERRTAQFVRK